MLNLSILLVMLPIWTGGFALLASARYMVRRREARLVPATVYVKHKG